MQNNRVVRVGDVVAWDKVPSMALVRVTSPDGDAFAQRQENRGCWLGGPGTLPRGGEWVAFGEESSWTWGFGVPMRGERTTIIALDVPADATADDLRRLAEVFEVREALLGTPKRLWAVDLAPLECPSGPFALIMDGVDIDTCWRVQAVDEVVAEELAAKRLHAAGWRPGMTAEDAARLLSESA